MAPLDCRKPISMHGWLWLAVSPGPQPIQFGPSLTRMTSTQLIHDAHSLPLPSLLTLQDADPLGFRAIDGDGAGHRDGHLNVHLEWCGGPM